MRMLYMRRGGGGVVVPGHRAFACSHGPFLCCSQPPPPLTVHSGNKMSSLKLRFKGCRGGRRGRMKERTGSGGRCQHILDNFWTSTLRSGLKMRCMTRSGKITGVGVLLAAPERQAKSQTRFFTVQKKKEEEKKEDKIKTWIIVKCRLFWI